MLSTVLAFVLTVVVLIDGIFTRSRLRSFEGRLVELEDDVDDLIEPAATPPAGPTVTLDVTEVDAPLYVGPGL